MKNHRDVCKATYAGFIEFDGLPGQIQSGCQKTPDYKSRYCTLHKPRVGILSQLPGDADESTSKHEESSEGVIETILEKKVTRSTTYYKVCAEPSYRADIPIAC